MSRFCVGEINEGSTLYRKIALICEDGNNFEAKLMKQTNIQQILKLITGIFYGITFCLYRRAQEKLETHVRHTYNYEC